MKEVSEAELARIRLARARAIDEERYKDEEPAPKKKKKKNRRLPQRKKEKRPPCSRSRRRCRPGRACGTGSAPRQRWGKSSPLK